MCSACRRGRTAAAPPAEMQRRSRRRPGQSGTKIRLAQPKADDAMQLEMQYEVSHALLSKPAACVGVSCTNFENLFPF